MPSRSGAIAGEGHEHQKPGWSAVHKVFVMMCLPLRRMGETAVQTLLKRIEAPKAPYPESLMFEAELMVRESTAIAIRKVRAKSRS